MGTIICQSCLSIMDTFEGKKVSVLYSNCGCKKNKESKILLSSKK